MKVLECMTSNVVTIEAQDGVPKALALLPEHRIRHLPVMDHGRLVGVVSERDLLEATGWDPKRAVDHEERRAQPVRDVMRVPPHTTEPQAELADAASRLLRRRVGCLPVMEDGKLAGILSELDVLGAFVRAARTMVLSSQEDPVLDDCATTDVVTVPTGTSAADALKLCRAEDVRHLPVVHDGWFVGLLSDRDLILAVGRGRAEETPVEEVMTRHFVALPPSARLSAAAARMVDERIGCVVVANSDKKLLGLVTTRDVLERCAPAIPTLGGRAS
jgi:acetoin utilization protein AcuB